MVTRVKPVSKAGPTKTVCTITDLLDAVGKQAEDWGFPNEDQNRPLFRGHASLAWRLRPSSLRGQRWSAKTCENENESIEEFLTKAPGLGGAVASSLSLWDGYFLMQHHSVPTRLLDWTESVLVAAYFAVSASTIDNDAAIWMLDPYELNEWNPDFKNGSMISPGFVGNRPREINKIRQWLPLCDGKKFDTVPRYPIAIYPAYFSRRIENQRSAFTIHGSKPDGLEELWRKGGPLLRIVIPGQKAMMIRGMLRDLGVNTATVFPDTEGLGKYLAERWGPALSRAPHHGVYTRLRPSKIDKGGVGVFAIRRIRKGTNVFTGESERLVWTDVDKIPSERSLKKLYTDFGVLRDGRYATPANFNSVGPGWYLNSSKKPNVRCDENLDFIAIRDIATGEELTADYDEYSDPVTPGR